jgi:hypothetical protein
MEGRMFGWLFRCRECERKEGVIQRYQNGAKRRDEMAAQIAALVKDRDHWKAMATEGSRSQARKLNEYRERALKAEAEAYRRP